MKKANQIKKPLLLVLLLAGIFIIEAFFSNFNYFAYVAGNNKISDYHCSDTDEVILYDENRTVTVEIPDLELNSVSFNVRLNSISANSEAVNVSYIVCDESSPSTYTLVRSDVEAIGIEAKRTTAFIRSQGNAKLLCISFSESDSEIIVSDIVVNPSYKISFNAARFCILCIFAGVIYILSVNENAKKLRSTLGYSGAAYISVYACVACTIAMWLLNVSSTGVNVISYPLRDAIDNYSPYIQQFDAFMKGQLHFDVEPTPELLSLENPYNPDSREGIYYLFDRALFNGKYYSYFGIAPIILVYFPFYFITHALPTDSTVSLIFSLMVAVYLPLAVIEWAKLRKRNIRPWLASVCGIGAFFSSAVLLIQRGYTPFYYIACISGMAFISAFAFWLLKALGAENRKKRIAYFVFSGLGFAFAFLSRVNSVIAPAIIIAVFVLIYSIKKIKQKQLLPLVTELFALALPVAAAVGFSLFYNYKRFQNPFQFGADYQLTIADASLYELGADGIIPSVIHYFLQPFGIINEFPYIGFDYLKLSDYGRYVYVDSNFGIFAIPFMLSLFLCVHIFKSKKAAKEEKALLAAGVLSLFITAFANFCLGGVIFRYTADISLTAAFISAVILLEICTSVQQSENSSTAFTVKAAATTLSVISAVIMLAVCIHREGNLISYNPEIYCELKKLFTIWS